MTPESGERRTRTWPEVYEALVSIGNLEDNWDGEGSPRPGMDLIDSAREVCRRLESIGCRPPDRVCASVSGTVYLEWYTLEGYLEIEVDDIVDESLHWRVGKEREARQTK